MSKRYHDADWLRAQYHGRGLTQREIAEECGVSQRAIRKWMKRHDLETREVRGENHGLYGEERDEGVKERISETMEGREMDEGWRQRIADAHSGRTLPESIRERISDSLTGITRSVETREKMSKSTAGAANPNWKGGHELRYGSGWSVAREAVVHRDEVCQHCGVGEEKADLDVHHIVPVRAFIEADEPISNAHDSSNLVLLCKSCHGRAEWGSIEFDSGIEDPRT